MGISRTLDELAKKIDVIAGDFPELVSRVIRKVALAVDQAAVLRTPVDTGRARSSWVVTLGVGTRLPVPPSFFDKSGQTAITAARSAVQRYRFGTGSIFVQNNVEYIEKLESGHSKQAPNGMLRFALLAGILTARRERVKIRRVR